MTLDEQWKPIEGFPNYEVSNKGRVKRLAHTAKSNSTVGAGWRLPELILSPHIKSDSGGTFLVRLKSQKDTYIQRKIHRLVGKAFLGTYDVTHISENKFDNSVSNLRLK